MSELVKGDAWDTYGAHLRETRDQRAEHAQALERAMAADSAVGDELTRQKLDARYQRGWMDALEFVLVLPQLLVDQNAKVQPPPAPPPPEPPPPPPAEPPPVRTSALRPVRRKRVAGVRSR